MSNQSAFDTPEDYLWVRYAGPIGAAIGTLIDVDRLYELFGGAAPETQVESMLAENTEWLRTYLEFAHGEIPITIEVGKPLPKFNEAWLAERRAERDGIPRA